MTPTSTQEGPLDPTDHRPPGPGPSEIVGRRPSRVRPHAEKVWLGADQIASSATNFAASALTAGLLAAAGFGAVSVAFAVYVIVAGASRAWSCEPLMLVASDAPEHERRDMVASSLGFAIAIGVCAGAVIVVLGGLLGGAVGSALAIMGVGLPGLLVHDACRYVLVMEGRCRVAFESDVVWLAVTIALLMWLRVANVESVALAQGAWVIGGCLAAIWAIKGSAARPTWRLKHWAGRVRFLSPTLTVEFFIVHISSSMTLVLVTALTADLAQTGEFRGTQVLLGPTIMCFAASSLYLRPIMVRAHRNGQSLRQRAIRESIVNTMVCLVWIAVVLLIPQSIGTRVFGVTWDGARSLVPVVSLAFIGAGAAAGALDAVRASGALRSVVRIRAVISIAVIGSMLVGARLLDDHGAITGFSVGALAGAAIAWLMAVRTSALR